MLYHIHISSCIAKQLAIPMRTEERQSTESCATEPLAPLSSCQFVFPSGPKNNLWLCGNSEKPKEKGEIISQTLSAFWSINLIKLRISNMSARSKCYLLRQKRTLTVGGLSPGILATGEKPSASWPNKACSTLWQVAMQLNTCPGFSYRISLSTYYSACFGFRMRMVMITHWFFYLKSKIVFSFVSCSASEAKNPTNWEGA